MRLWSSLTILKIGKRYTDIDFWPISRQNEISNYGKLYHEFNKQ